MQTREETLLKSCVDRNGTGCPTSQIKIQVDAGHRPQNCLPERMGIGNCSASGNRRLPSPRAQRSDRATSASRMKGDHAVAVKRMIKGTTIAVVPSAAITEAKRRYRTP